MFRTEHFATERQRLFLQLERLVFAAGVIGQWDNLPVIEIAAVGTKRGNNGPSVAIIRAFSHLQCGALPRKMMSVTVLITAVVVNCINDKPASISQFSHAPIL